MASPKSHEARRDEVVKVVSTSAAALLHIVSTWNERVDRQAMQHLRTVYNWLSFQAKQKLNAINREIPSAPRVTTSHNSDVKSPCLCRWSDYQNPACTLRWYFCSWHCNYQHNTKYYTVSDILMITLDAIWKLKPIRFIIRRQLHDTVDVGIRVGKKVFVYTGYIRT